MYKSRLVFKPSQAFPYMGIVSASIEPFSSGPCCNLICFIPGYSVADLAHIMRHAK